MKALNTYVNEWRASSNTVSSIKKIPYFIHKLTTYKNIKVFDNDWPHFNDYKDKVYINGEHINIKDNGGTIKVYEPGTYYVEIKDIDNVTNCHSMFFNCVDLLKITLFDTSKVKTMDEMFSYCEHLISVPLFDTSKVKNMSGMFSDCYRLEDVPLFDMNKVTNIRDMFFECKNLSEQTKQEWSQIYNFETHNKR